MATMGTTQFAEFLGGKALVDLTGKENLCVKHGVGGWTLCTVEGEKVEGVCYTPAAIGENSSAVICGFTMVVSGAAITDGAEVMVDANGKAIPYVAANGKYVFGRAYSAVSASGMLVWVRLLHPYQ